MSEYTKLLVENHDRPYATFTLVLPMGTLGEPLGQEGLAYLAGNMLLKGTKTRSHTELTEAVDHIGSTLDVVVGREFSSLRGDAVRRHLDTLVELASDVLTNPVFDEDELERLKRQTLAELKALRNHDEALARNLHHSLVFDGHPYGRPAKGSEASLARIGREDIVRFFEERVRKGGILVASSGDVRESEVDRWLEERFHALPEGKPSAFDFPKLAKPSGRTLLFVDKPERNQTQIVIGHSCIDANHPDYFPLLISNTAFGGTFTSRVSQEIREKRGWSYGASADFAPSFRTGSFAIHFTPENQNTVAGVRLALDLMSTWREDGITEEELAFAKSFRAGRFPFKIDTPQKRLEQALVGRLLGWPDDHLERYMPQVEAVTKEQADAAVRRQIDPDNLTITVLGTADGVLDELKELPGLSRVIVHPYDEEWTGAP